MSDLLIAVTDQTFDSEVLKSDKPALVDFWAAWCGPCRALAPTVEAIAKEYEGRLKVCKVDVDTSQIYAGQFGIRSIPTLLLFKDGKVKESLVGNAPKIMITEKIDKHL
jgi:thioredoxin 1